MWKGFDQAEGWEHVSTEYSSNNTEIHLLRMYSSAQTQITASLIYAFKIITISPPTLIVSNKAIQKVSLKDKDVVKVKTEIVALQRLRGYAGVVQLYEILLEDNKNGWRAFFSNFLSKCRNNGKTICFVLEYCPHGTLKEYISSHQMEEADIVAFCLKIFESLISLRECGILHRDLRSANLMLAEDQVKLIDFDCSFIRGYSTLDNLTYSFVVSSTAPEVCRLIDLKEQEKQQLSPQKMFELQEKCDLYSFGTIIVQMITKKQYSKSMNLQGEISQELLDLITGLLQQDPSQRFDLSQAEQYMQILSQKHSIKHTASRRKMTRLSMLVPPIEADPTNSSQSLSNKPSLSDWSLESTSTKQLSNTSKNLSRCTTINQYLARRTINE